MVNYKPIKCPECLSKDVIVTFHKEDLYWIVNCKNCKKFTNIN